LAKNHGSNKKGQFGGNRLAQKQCFNTKYYTMTTNTNIVAMALKYVEAGYPVLPVHSLRGGVCTCRKAKTCSSPGKHPRTRHGVSDATREAKKVRGWWKKWPDANIGIATGRESGILAVDIDPGHGGKESIRELENLYGNLPSGPISQTGGGGWHLIFNHPGHPLSNRVGIADGIDIRADGGYIVAPNSRHLSGLTYKWQASPTDIEPPDLPDSWLIFLSSANVTQTTQDNTGHPKDLPKTSKDINGKWPANFGKGDTPGKAGNPPPDIALERAMATSMPYGSGQRHDCLFAFTRHLRAIPELANRPILELRPYVDEWYKRATEASGVEFRADGDTNWFDFAEGWGKVRYPSGQGIMTEILERASTGTMPAVAKHYQTDRVKLLIAVCRELAREHEGKLFYLSTRLAADVMDVIPMQASRTLRGLEIDGVLECVEQGTYTSRKASTWRYLPPLDD
jgi:bifunctional DNA primase/polymerase-like protein